jgi:hypothetical protein
MVWMLAKAEVSVPLHQPLLNSDTTDRPSRSRTTRTGRGKSSLRVCKSSTSSASRDRLAPTTSRCSSASITYVYYPTASQLQ